MQPPVVPACVALVWAGVLLSCSGRLVLPDQAPCEAPGCACFIDAQCAGEMRCIDGACAELAACSAMAPSGVCPEGRTCSAGVCVRGGAWCEGCTPEQACVEGACRDINESDACTPGRPEGLCPTGEVCVGGACVTIDEHNACSAEHPQGLCQDGAACVDGVCVPASEDPCGAENPDGACDNGRVCVPPGRCELPACSASAPAGYCPPAQFCSGAGSCIPNGSCAIDADCDARYTCVAQACVRDLACTSSDDCFATERCSVTGQCISDGLCNADGDCDGGEVCSSEGRCIEAGTCSRDADCAPSKFCSTSGTCIEAGQCAGINDCPPGYVCDSGNCVPSGQACTVNVKDPASCPVGETCCPDGQRCSAHGTCIPEGRCVDDTDCISTYACVDYTCTPEVYCTDGCATGEVCSYSGGCIPAGQCVVDGDCPEAEVCSATFECRIGEGCGSTEFAATLVKPNMLIVLDRSGSMNRCTDEGGACDSASDCDPGYRCVPNGNDDICAHDPTRWAEALAAIDRVLTDHSDKIRFGLSTYPHICADASPCSATCSSNYCNNNCDGSNNCAAGEVDVAVSDNTTQAIRDALSANFPGGFTPTGKTLRAIAAEPASFGLPHPADPVARDNYVLLVTDGEANCDGRNAPTKVNAAIKSLRDLDNPVITYVVGFGFTSVSSNLNCNAVYGGTARAGCTAEERDCYTDDDGNERCRCYNRSSPACYYEANNLDTLSQAFNEIASLVASCSYTLDQAPELISQLYVYFDYGDRSEPVRVQRDPTHQDNWDYDPVTNRITFYGNACHLVQDGAVTARVIYGCPDAGG